MMPGYCLWYPDGHCIAAVSTVFGDLVPVYQYDPGNGKSDSVAGPDCLSSGTDLYPADLYLNHMFGLEGVIYAQPAADYLSIVVAILICTHLFEIWSIEMRALRNKRYK